MSSGYTIFVEIEGIRGDSSYTGHEGWIQARSISWSIDRAMNTAPGRVQNRENSEVKLQEITLTKYIDSATPRLFLEACTGRRGLNTRIHFVSTAGAGQVDMEYTLTNTLVNHYSTSQILLEDNKTDLFETIKLNFTKIEVTFTARDEGGKAKSPVRSHYDLATARGG
jgi:type VI secretion system secreted protein Hcp